MFLFIFFKPLYCNSHSFNVIFFIRTNIAVLFLLTYNFLFRTEVKWRQWVDDVFIHTLSPNIYRTMSESFQALSYITQVGNFGSFERKIAYYSGAVAMYIIGKRIKKRLNSY